MKGNKYIYQITKEKTRNVLWKEWGGGGCNRFWQTEAGMEVTTGFVLLAATGCFVLQVAVNKITLFRRQIKADFSLTDDLLPAFFGMGFEHFADPA